MKKIIFAGMLGLAITACKKEEEGAIDPSPLYGYWTIDNYEERYYDENGNWTDTVISPSTDGLSFTPEGDFYVMDDSTRTDTSFYTVWEMFEENRIIINNVVYRVSGLGTDLVDLTSQEINPEGKEVVIIALSR